jgi:vacuolar-type H+-ATPase subunit F/Vma7
MSRIAALGERSRIQGYSIAGVEVMPAGTADAAVAAWRTLPSHVAVLILTPQAAAALAGRMSERPDVLVAVLP